MGMFETIPFATVTTSGRGGTNDLVSITHSATGKKNEIMFRLSREAIDKAGLNYQDKVLIQFDPEFNICRIVKSQASGAVTLGQQVKDSESSAGIVRLTYKPTLPNFVELEEKKTGQYEGKVKFIHEDDMIEFIKDEGQVTFKLKRV